MRGGLAGRRIVLTRRWPELVAALEATGAAVTEVPAIVVTPPADPEPLEAALLALESYDWLVFTSANAVEAVRARLEPRGAGIPRRVRLASVGPATTRAVGEAWPGTAVSVQPPADFKGESLVGAFAGHDLAGRRVLLPVSDRAADTVARGLALLGAQVDRVVAYRTVARADADRVQGELRRGVDALVFASPSAVAGVLEAAGDLARQVPAVAIGPTTAEAVRTAGLSLLATAEASTVEGVVAALAHALTLPA
ncbi:MAG TPA: uroporphyrinogen-III synthase [Vicinamibacteria bacterium]|nr:uroporphyrinogen-III synthase [Vicinamibacteria bacterium]